MYLNPVNTAAGLLDELESAIRAGRDETETAVRTELAAVVSEARAMDVSDLDDGQKDFVAATLARVDAVLAAGTEATPVAEAEAAPAPAGKRNTAAAKAPRTA